MRIDGQWERRDRSHDPSPAGGHAILRRPVGFLRIRPGSRPGPTAGLNPIEFRTIVKNPTRKLARNLAVVLLLALAAGCDDLGPSGPRGPGSIGVDLVSPNGAEASAVLEVVGGTGLGAVTVFGGDVFYQHRSDTTRVVIVLDTPGQISFRIRSQDVRNLPSVALVQVADGNDQLRDSLVGYGIEFLQLEDGGSQ